MPRGQGAHKGRPYTRPHLLRPNIPASGSLSPLPWMPASAGMTGGKGAQKGRPYTRPHPLRPNIPASGSLSPLPGCQLSPT